MTNHNPERMVSRLRPTIGPAHPEYQGPATVVTAPPPWKIVLTASDGTELLSLTEVNGKLEAAYPPDRVGEAARRLFEAMLQMSGQLPVPWKDTRP